MRICYICVGGFGHIAPYLNFFKSAGHDVHFISLSTDVDYNVTTYNVGMGGEYSKTKGKWKYPLSMFRARRLVKKIRPDIVHTHYVTSGGVAGLVCNFHPTITTVHGSDINESMKSGIWKFLLRRVFQQADCVNTCTEDQKRKVMSLGINPKKIYVLTLGIDTDKFFFAPRQWGCLKDTIRLVTTRRLENCYDHFTIIRALAILRRKGIKFKMTFAAGGPLQDNLKEMVKKEELENGVYFLGGVGKDRIIEILHNNDIFLSAPVMDGISIALLEALSVGLFPIVSQIEVNSDWIKNGVDGFLHKVGDAESLAECILKIRNNYQSAAEAVQNNRKKVVGLADTKTNMERLEKIYEQLISKKFNTMTDNIQ
jgi:glycosyltransferase involved in cell wall biosynthesis